jgi:hypothetical protein
MVPYKSDTNQTWVAYADDVLNPIWTTELVDSTKTPYTQFQAGAGPPFSFEFPTTHAAGYINGKWNVFFIDDANHKGSGDTPGIGNGNLQTVWRCEKTGAAWGAPVAYYQTSTWVNTVDIAVDSAGSRFCLVVSINAPSFLNPYVIFDDFGAVGDLILTTGIAGGGLGAWSGITGGDQGSACGAGRTLPAGGGAGPGCGGTFLAQ